MFRTATSLLALSFAAAAAAAPLEIRQGERICLIGNTFAERLAESGYLESMMHARFPDRDFTLRSLAWPADTLTLRPRPQDSLTTDQHLTEQKASLIIACFGLNESFEMPVAQFRAELEKFIDHTLAQKYDGKDAPRLVMIAPAAMEDLKLPGRPDAARRNAEMLPFVNAMVQVCTAKKIVCVNTFQKFTRPQNDQPLTINGIHLNDYGSMAVAVTIDAELFGPPGAFAKDWTREKFEVLRKAVQDKNYWFFQRYRPVNPFYIFGGRSKPYGVVTFPPELEYLDGMVTNRERRIREIAQGKTTDLKIDDSNLKPLPEYPTELKGDPELLSPEDEQKTFKLLDGFEVNLFAGEVQFPDLAKPTQMTFDSEGRMWICTIPSYPHLVPGTRPDDKVIVLTDKDKDGRADECKVFADGLYIPTGIELGFGGAYVAQQPDLMFLKDTDGDGRADTRERVLQGFGTEDSHHSISAFCWGPGGGLYMMEGTFHHSQVETPWGPTRLQNAGVFRYEPRSERLDVHVTYNYANPWGETWDKWGRNFIADASGGDNHYGNAYSGWLPYPEKHSHMERFTPQAWHLRPTSGCEIVSSRQFPDEYQGWWLLNNVIGFQGTRMFRLQDDGSGFKAVEYKDLIQSDHRNFRPVDIEFGPDGALYIADWYNPIVGHMSYSLRDPARDKMRGRIWRITAKDRKVIDPVSLTGAKVDELMEMLRAPEDRLRYRVKRELAQRTTIDVLGAVERFVRRIKDEDPEKERLLLEALWVQQHHDAVQRDLLLRVLKSSEPKARAAAVQVLRYWRDRVSEAGRLLKEAANDENPAVRLEAVVAASYVHSVGGVEIALEAVKRPLDYYIGYALKETLRALDPWLKEAVRSGTGFAADNPAGQSYVLSGLTNPEVLALPKSPAVHQELLRREGVGADVLTAAVKALAGPDRTAAQVLLEALPNARGSSLARVLAGWDAAELKAAIPSLTALAAKSDNPDTRRSALAALAAADAEAAWDFAKEDPARLTALCQVLPLVASPATRGAIADRIEPLLGTLPEPLAAKAASSSVSSGRFVRVEHPRKGTLSLTEVEVYSGGKNIALGGKASQSSTAYGGEASRAIDGNTHGEWGRGTTTHTEIDETNPWWEVDLGSPQPVERVVIINRNDPGSTLGKRLDGFRLTVLDSDRRVLFTHDHGAAAGSLEVPVTADAAAGLRAALVTAFASAPDREAAKLARLLPLIDAPATRAAVITVLKDLDLAKADPQALAAAAAGLAEKLPAVPLPDRLGPAFSDSIALARKLAAQSTGLAAKLQPVIAKEAPVTLELKADVQQLIYDRKSLDAPAGGVIALSFENPGEQPHNVVVCTPGSLEKVGAAADAMQTDPNGLARGFVPEIPEVLEKTRMLNRGERETLVFRVPATPGDYVLICTFPGHWRLMQGVLHVK